MVEPSTSSNLFLISASLVVGAALAMGLTRTWQIAVLAFLVQYVALGVLVLELGSSARSGLRILVGTLICLVLFLTARRTRYAENEINLPVVDRRWLSETVFRLAAVSLAAIGVFGTSIPHRFPALPAELVLTSAWLMAIGAVIVLVSRELLWVGLGLLTLESGFETIYTAVDPRLEPAGLLAAGGLLLALVVATAITVVDRGRTTP